MSVRPGVSARKAARALLCLAPIHLLTLARSHLMNVTL